MQNELEGRIEDNKIRKNKQSEPPDGDNLLLRERVRANMHSSFKVVNWSCWLNLKKRRKKRGRGEERRDQTLLPAKANNN